MKKSKKYSVILGFVMLVSAFSTSCSPSACDCYKNAMNITSGGYDKDLQKKCADYANTLSSEEKLERLSEMMKCK